MVMNTITLQLLRMPLHVWRRVLGILPSTISDRVKILLVRGHYLDNLREGTPVIVYQMGKVGSSSVKNSLISCGVKPVFHLHLINPHNIMKIEQDNIVHNYPVPMHGQISNWLGKMLYSEIAKGGRSSKFITLVREPISRNISGFFQSFRRYTGVEYEDSNFTIIELINIFINDYQHTFPLTWFDVEVKPVLGIDVYQYIFPKEKGYLTIRQGNFELLIIKIEVDDLVKEKAIREFLCREDFRLTRSNVAQDKDYTATYREFLEAIELPESYVEIMCNSEYVRHFYTDAEIEATQAKWLNKFGKTELQPAIHEGLLRAASRVVD